MRRTVDAVVVGAGPNGLVAANALADAGWDVLLLEANDEVGGAVRSGDVTVPGFRSDLFSAFYPLAAASPAITALELERYGLRWLHAPAVLAHALDDGRSAVLHHDVDATAAGLDVWADGDGDAWRRLVDGYRRLRDPLLDALFTPIPPVRALARILARTRTAGALEIARLAALPVRRLGQETFRGEGGGLLLTGNALHADIPPDAAGSGLYGWLLAMLGQDVGFPVPEGGAGRLAEAMRRRFEAAGGEVLTGAQVTHVEVRAGRAVGVRTAGGLEVGVRRAVLADVSAPALFGRLLHQRDVPAALRRRMETFQWDYSTFKLDWALDGPVPWTAEGARGAGTVHLGVDDHGFVQMAADLAMDRIPERPFLLFGQMTTADPSRSPAGTESAWAYTHVPHGITWDADAVNAQVRRVEAAVERAAPGFTSRIVGRYVQSPTDIEAADANLVDGATNGGTASIHQQLVFRPTTGLGRPETPVTGLYLASAGAHPGGGVHGACGWNAARVALGQAGPTGALRRALVHTTWDRVLPDR